MIIDLAMNQDDAIIKAIAIGRQNMMMFPQSYDLLCQMALEIKKNEVEGEHTALCVMRTKNDTDADGSQAIVNELKKAITMVGGFKYTYSAVCFEDIERLYNKKGYRHFVVVYHRRPRVYRQPKESKVV